MVGTRDGLTLNYNFYCCADAIDTPHACDGLEDHTHVKLVATGSLGMSMNDVNRHVGWIVRDNATNAPYVGGKGNDAFSFSTETSAYTISYTDDAGHVAFDPFAPALPLGGGTNDLALTVHRTRATATPTDRDFTVVAHFDYSAADTVTMTLDESEVYTLTVSTGVVVHQ